MASRASSKLTAGGVVYGVVNVDDFSLGYPTLAVTVSALGSLGVSIYVNFSIGVGAPKRCDRDGEKPN